ncbi:hypothetical protein HZQ75_02065 [Elizabethkingia anophelis]|uniref:Fibrobacter succinogenes major paralogous domain-containing protein n=2 Tax=Elizabethkingia TaxID=308865 RepID=A0ABM6MSC7_9FLAO|nr:FISUMP domain-containing protein [Elizabethkingia anophelis]ATC35811.1 hypothetical protein BAZ09_006090 [Elizabethkingia anophelis R26]ATC39449.1 hypothetical protein EAAG1_006090 [Elizabethkingia anophelis Ag1]ATC43128.1 hypothetical protein CMV41_06090 [Elizabethkingia anophelis]ATC46804.1 hypothetical protein CMV40_06090 [Elizabethkingia anophelis]ELR81166.1 hypothetical protein D505_00700 [Elizabethkingia anophelis R26]
MKILHNKYRAIITSLILVITSLIFILSFLSLSSCRSTDIDQDKVLKGSEISGGLAAVNINLLGAEYANSNKPAQVASINQKGLNVDNDVQHYSVLVSPSSFITAELTPNRSLSSVASSKNLNTIAAVAGDQLGAGNKFRVIAYRQSDGTYQTYQDYTVGQPVAPLMLDGGVNYDIVAYSYGVTTLPVISSGEQSNINSATINYDNLNRDLMYQKISYTPNGSIPNNTLNIMLRHKLTQITTIINSVNLGNITNASGILTPHYHNGIFSLNTGLMSGRTDISSGEQLSYSSSQFPGTTVTAMPSLINANTEGNATGSFSSNNITIAGTTKTISLPNSFKITPENKSNLTVNIVKCGAYIGPNNDPANYKEFMCQNLGATSGINPFSPEAGNHGAKYQWGYKPINANLSDDRYYTQSDDQSNPGVISGWNTTEKSDDSWSDTSKTANDPCPSGYRVTTAAQWEAVIDNNPNIERVGSWLWDNGNYTSALYFRTPSNVRTLMLPAAGYRHNGDGSIYERGRTGAYWSSNNSGNFSVRMSFTKSSLDTDDNTRLDGFSVRCVAE